MKEVLGQFAKAGWQYRALLGVALLCCACVWIFAEVADEVREGEWQTVEQGWMRQLRSSEDPSEPAGPVWMKTLALDATALGGVLVLTLLCLMVTGYLLLSRWYASALLLVAAAGGGILVSTVLKNLFSRERPDAVPHLTDVTSASFPSGHSMMSSIVYLTLAVMLARTVERRRMKVYVVGIALFILFLVGLSRIYLGVHYPTDVLAGWTAGIAWALLCALAAYGLERRGKIEPEADEGK
jgi:undecaprenyl-diphosphatase